MTDAELAAEVAKANGRVFIGFKDPGASAGVDAFGRVLTNASAITAGRAAILSTGARIEMAFKDMPTVVARISPADLTALRHNPRVEYVEPIFPGVRTARRGLPVGHKAAGFDGARRSLSLPQFIPWSVDTVGAPAVWPSSTGSGVKLLIIDSGVDDTHPDLNPAVIHTCMPYPANGVDQNGHGTEVAGIAAALNNTIGIVGVAPGVSLWSVQDGGRDGNTDPAATACGIEYGRMNNVDVINISEQIDPYTAITDQINSAYYENGIVVVASAGNCVTGPGQGYGCHAPVRFPASLKPVIAVSATTSTDSIASFSDTGVKVELAAPGDNVPTTSAAGGYYTGLSGTSLSSPAVAAAAAILKSYNPSWSNVEIRARLNAGATEFGAPGHDSRYGYGLLNIPAAMAASVPPITSVSIDGPTQIQPGATCIWNGAISGGTPPYSYQWFNGTMPGGTEDFYSGSNGPGHTNPYFLLRLYVTGKYGLEASASLTVHEKASAPLCPY